MSERRMKMPAVDDIVRTCADLIFAQPLVTNVYRSILVEAMIAKALPDWQWCSSDYASYDFCHSDGTRLEAKQSAVWQTWSKDRPSKISWDIRPRTGYWEDGTLWVPTPGRNADIYVLGYHPITGSAADHRDPRQWRFFVVTADALPDTKRLSLARAEQIATHVGFGALADCIEEARARLKNKHDRRQS